MSKHITDFGTALQFLSRIKFFRQDSWTDESFARSTKWFPLVGCLIGLGDVLIWWLASPYFSGVALGALLILSHLFWAGAICYDGLMDTGDGVFSGRSREKMLEIMRDSSVGAFGVLTGVVAILLRFAFLSTLSGIWLPISLGLIPVISRWSMVSGITLFPYARPEGLGKSFSTNKGSLYFATFLVLIFFSAVAYNYGWIGVLMIGVMGIIASFLLQWWLTKKLGGLTGDCYGAVTEATEVFVLLGMTGWIGI